MPSPYWLYKHVSVYTHITPPRVQLDTTMQTLGITWRECWVQFQVRSTSIFFFKYDGTKLLWYWIEVLYILHILGSILPFDRCVVLRCAALRWSERDYEVSSLNGESELQLRWDRTWYPKLRHENCDMQHDLEIKLCWFRSRCRRKTDSPLWIKGQACQWWVAKWTRLRP